MDLITENVVGAIEPRLQLAEIARATGKSTENLDAYDLYLRAMHDYYKMTRPELDSAVHLLQRALAMDPNYALAKGFLAFVYAFFATHDWSAPTQRESAIVLAREVIASGSDDPGALRYSAHALSHFAQDFPAALVTLNRALRLQPSSAQVLSSLGWVHCHAGDPELAIEYFERSLRLSPLDLEIGVTLSGLGVAYLMTGRAADAYAPLRRAVEERPRWATGYRNLIPACVRLGRLDEARAVGSRMLGNIPNTRIGYTSPMSNEDYVTEQREAMRLAGIPE